MADSTGIDTTDAAFGYGRSLLRGDKVTLRAMTDEDVEVLAGWRGVQEWAIFNELFLVPKPHAAMADWIRGRGKNTSLSEISLSIVTVAGELCRFSVAAKRLATRPPCEL